MRTIGIILAGGKSSRMGRDKALIVHKGVTLLQHARNLLTALDISDITVLGRSGESDGIADPLPNAGPAANLIAFLNSQKVPVNIVVLPVDMPLLEPQHVLHLLSFPSGAYFEDLYLPFTAIINESIKCPGDRMKVLLKTLQIVSITPNNAWLHNLVNVNEIGDLEALGPHD